MRKTDLVIGKHYLYKEDGNPFEPGMDVILLTKGYDPFIVGVGCFDADGELNTFPCFTSSLFELQVPG